MGKLIFAVVLLASVAAYAQSPNLGINRVYPAPPKPRAPETAAAAAQAAVPDRLSSIGRKLQEVQHGLLRSAEIAGRLRSVKASTPLQKSELAANGQALMAEITDHQRSLTFVQDSIAGVARQPLNQSERAQAESYLKNIAVLKRHAQAVAGVTQDVIRQNAAQPSGMVR